MREVLLATADGIVIFHRNDGTILEGETFLVRDMYILIILAQTNIDR